MKTIKIHTRFFTLLISVLVMFQSCTIYKSTSVTLAEVANKHIETKVETKNQEKFHFKYISYENGNYYGVRKVKGKIEKIKLNEEYIDSIKPKDETTSTILTIALPVVILGAAVALYFEGLNNEIEPW